MFKVWNNLIITASDYFRSKHSVPAIVNQDPVNQTNYTAGTASLSCVVGGLPVVSIIWLKNGQLISESPNITISNLPNSTLTTGQVTSTITFNNLTLDDAAQYQCVGNNTGAPGIEFTVTSAAATLTVLCEYNFISQIIILRIVFKDLSCVIMSS